MTSLTCVIYDAAAPLRPAGRTSSQPYIARWNQADGRHCDAPETWIELPGLQNSAAIGIDSRQLGGESPVGIFCGQAVKAGTCLVRQERRKMQAGCNLADQLAGGGVDDPRTPGNPARTLVSSIHLESELFIDEQFAGGCGDAF